MNKTDRYKQAGMFNGSHIFQTFDTEWYLDENTHEIAGFKSEGIKNGELIGKETSLVIEKVKGTANEIFKEGFKGMGVGNVAKYVFEEKVTSESLDYWLSELSKGYVKKIERILELKGIIVVKKEEKSKEKVVETVNNERKNKIYFSLDKYGNAIGIVYDEKNMKDDIIYVSLSITNQELEKSRFMEIKPFYKIMNEKFGEEIKEQIEKMKLNKVSSEVDEGMQHFLNRLKNLILKDDGKPTEELNVA